MPQPPSMNPIDADAITSRNSLESPLLRLPAELRVRIYEYAIGSNVLGPVFRGLPPRPDFPHYVGIGNPTTGRKNYIDAVASSMFGNSQDPYSVRCTHFSQFLPLGLTCRQTAAETELLLFKTNIFVFGSQDPDVGQFRRVAGVTRKQHAAIQNMACSVLFGRELVGPNRFFTDENFSIKNDFPNLKKVFIIVDNDMRCRRYVAWSFPDVNEDNDQEIIAVYKQQVANHLGISQEPGSGCEVVLIYEGLENSTTRGAVSHSAAHVRLFW